MSPLSPRFCSLAALWSRSLTLGTLGLLFCVLGVATPSKSAETKPAWFTTPGHIGALVIDVPADWQYKSRSRGGAPTTVTMRTDDSVLHFTLLWNATDSPDFNSAEQQMKMLKETSVEYVLDKTEGGSVDLEFESLTGSEVEGLYTVLLNTKGPNEFRTLTPGIFSVGEFRCSLRCSRKKQKLQLACSHLKCFADPVSKQTRPPGLETRKACLRP